MNLYFEFAADRSAATRDQQNGAFHTTYLGDDGARDKAVAFAVMADGVEGHSGGQVASNLVVSTFNRAVVRTIGTLSFPRVLRDAMEAANSALGDAIEETPDLQGMACTVTAVLLVGGRLHWASVGDLSLLLLRGGEVRRLNADHSYGAFLEQARAEGVDATPEEGLTPDMLMSAVTGEEIPDIDCPTQGLDLEDGDRIILAGRALQDLDDALVLRAARAGKAPREAVSALAGAVESARGEREQGTTLIVLDVRDSDPAPVVATPEAVSVAAAPSVAAEPPKGSLLLNLLTGFATLVIFLGGAAGAWFALAEINAWRATSDASDSTTAVVPAAPVAPSPGIATGSTPAVPPAPPPPAGGSLSFGAPAPPISGSGVPAPPPALAPVAPPADGFRDPLEGGGEGPLMVPIPAGTFQMGARSPAVHPAAAPRREVSVAAFALSAFEVTVAQYAPFARATGRTTPDIQDRDPETTPVGGVSWDDAYAYTVWLSKQTGKRYRLPSEAEWEYAARAGTSTSFWWGNQVGKDRAHCFDCDTGLNTRRASRVGRFDANPFGLHDTAGNLAEWVHDCWHPNYRGAPADGNVWEGGDCESRVVRGGGFTSTSTSMHSGAREAVPAGRALESVGFRIARDL